MTGENLTDKQKQIIHSMKRAFERLLEQIESIDDIDLDIGKDEVVHLDEDYALVGNLAIKINVEVGHREAYEKDVAETFEWAKEHMPEQLFTDFPDSPDHDDVPDGWPE